MINTQKGPVTYLCPQLGWNGPQETPDPELLPNGSICSCCGKASSTLTMVDDETYVCPHCLDFNYIRCDECGEY